MKEHSNLPDTNRLSVLAATILLAYAFTRFVNIPERSLAFSLLGVYIEFQINFQTAISVLVAALAAAGMDWLVQDHPVIQHREKDLRFQLLSDEAISRLNLSSMQLTILPWSMQNRLQHWLLPALTAWVIGVPLSNLANGPEWWAVFALGGGLLILVFVAEYIVVDIRDSRQPIAASGLTALSFALFLMLSIALRTAGLRLYLLLPAMVLAAGLVTLRSLYLRLSGKWAFAWALGVTMAISQLATGLHYLPLSPLKYGLVLLGPAYALTVVSASIQEEKNWRNWIAEPLAMLVIVWGLAIWVK